jgi:hypothetical protein
MQAKVVVKEFTAVSLRSGQGRVALPKGLFSFPRPSRHLDPKLSGQGDDRGGRGKVTPLFPEKGHREVKDNALPDFLRPRYPTQHLRKFR